MLRRIFLFLHLFHQSKSIIEICALGHIAPNIGVKKAESFIKNSKNFNLIYNKGGVLSYQEK